MTPESFNPKGSPEHSQTSVKNTINNFNNEGLTNIPLWLFGDAWSMVYAGVDEGPFDNNVRRPESQSGLNRDDVVVSIILPSGYVIVLDQQRYEH